jgi:hypothetical protein
MKRNFITADMHDALDGFVQAGLVHEFVETTAESSAGRMNGFEKRDRVLIRKVIVRMIPRFVEGGKVLFIGDAEDKFLHLDAEYLQRLGVAIPAPAKIPDVIVYYAAKNWLLLIEAVTSAGPVDGKRRKELKELFAGCKAGLVFVTAFETRRAMQSFVSHIAWESEVWIADDPDHMIHFNGERFLGPYPDVLPG